MTTNNSQKTSQLNTIEEAINDIRNGKPWQHLMGDSQ